ARDRGEGSRTPPLTTILPTPPEPDKAARQPFRPKRMWIGRGTGGQMSGERGKRAIVVSCPPSPASASLPLYSPGGRRSGAGSRSEPEHDDRVDVFGDRDLEWDPRNRLPLSGLHIDRPAGPAEPHLGGGARRRADDPDRYGDGAALAGDRDRVGTGRRGPLYARPRRPHRRLRRPASLQRVGRSAPADLR